MLRALKTVSAIAAFATLAIAGSASADPISWSTNGDCAVGFTCNSSEMSFLGSDGTTVVTARAWSYNGSQIEAASLGKWNGGLGVMDRGESGGSPNHTVDNSGRNDFVAFYFSETVDINAVRVTSYGDTDMSIWIGTVAGVPSFSGQDISDLDTNYGSHFDNYGGDENRKANFGADAETGNLMVVAALVPANGIKDYFKIKKLYADSVDILPPTEPDAVSAPATLLVFGPALFGLALVRRRNTRKGAAAESAAAKA